MKTKFSLLYIAAFIILQGNAQNTIYNEPYAKELTKKEVAVKQEAKPKENKSFIKTAIEKVVKTLTQIIANQMKTAMNIVAEITTNLLKLTGEITEKSIKILNQQLAIILKNIADASKKAIAIGVDVSVCTSKKASLLKLITKLALPLNICITTQVEGSIKIVGVIKDNILETLSSATAFIASVFDCDNLSCSFKKYLELTGMCINIPLKIGKLLWDLSKVLTNATLKCVACQLKIEERFVAKSEPVIDEIMKCIDEKMEKQS